MTKRHDPHAPVNLVTEDYEYLYAADLDSQWALGFSQSDEGREFLRKLANLDPATAGRGYHQCHHCGAWIRYAAWLEHVPTGYTIVVGETCLENRFALATADFQKLRKAAALDRKAQRIRKLVAAFVEANPDLGWMGIRNAEERQAAMPEASRQNGFLLDLGRKLNQYGELSERQVAAIRPSLARDVEFAAKRAAAEAAKAEEPEAGPVPTGRGLVIEGVVVGRAWKDTDFGPKMKITVKLDNGSKVWFSEPSKVQCERGDRIRCRLSEVVPSSDDRSFGFGKRPTQFEVIEEAAS